MLVPEKTWQDIRALRSHGADFLLIDTRDADEWESGHLEGAIHIPLSSLEFKIWQGGFPKDIPIIVYCQTGKRSALACKLFADKGYANAFNLQEGYLGVSPQSGATHAQNARSGFGL